MGVYKGTTPTVVLQFDPNDVDLTLARNVYVTFKSNINTLTKTGDSLDIESDKISVYLTQADTLAFQVDRIEVQANWTYDGGSRACSNIAVLEVGRNLLTREVE